MKDLDPQARATPQGSSSSIHSESDAWRRIAHGTPLGRASARSADASSRELRPRRFAVSSSSSIRMPEPSPSTKPSRSLSNGRLARVGSSLRCDRARKAANPPTPIGHTAASVPPVIIASAAPRLMISNESPTAWAEAVHAVHVARFGPLAPNRIDTCPAARLMMDDGMKNGEIFRGPPPR